MLQRRADDNRPDRKPDHPITFQAFFKSVGPRTYAAQVKVATNGNHYLVLTEGQRDAQTGQVGRKRINIFSEDFDAFFNLLRDTARHIRAHPVPEHIRQRQADYWARQRPAAASAEGDSGTVEQ